MTTDSTIAAVLDFVNAGGTELEWQLRSRADVLLTDDADTTLQRLIEQHRDDPESITHLRQRRRLLQECREFGVERGLAPPRPVSAEVEQIVLQYMNLPDGNELRTHVAAHLDTLTTPDAERVFRDMRLTYLDDDTIQEHLRRRIAILETARYHGIDQAFADTMFVVTPDLDEAMTALLNAAPTTVGEVLQRHADVLLGDEAERMLTFILDDSPPSADDEVVARMRRLRSILRVARSYGITTAVNLVQSGEVAPDTSAAYDAFGALVEADQADDWRRVVELGTETLRLINREQFPSVWAVAHAMIGTALSREPTGDRASALDASIAHHEQARQILTLAEDRWAWAMNEHHLALAYLQRLRGDHTANVEAAITILRELIAALGEGQTAPEIHITLADALRQRRIGSRAGNLNEAVTNLDAVLAHDDGNGSGSARALLQLGLVYLEGRSGESANDVEQAVDLLAHNLSAIDPATDLTSWAHTARSLAIAYLRRVLGDPLTNWQAALDLLAEVTEACPKERAPMLWAENQLAVAGLHREHPGGSSPQRLQLQARLTESVLDVYTRHDHPDLWAKVQMNLGAIHAELGDLEEAARHLDRAFEVYTRERAPQRWAAVHASFGRLNLMRAKHAADKDQLRLVEAAVAHFSRALEVRTVDADPSGRLQLLRLIGQVRFHHGQWYEALGTFVDAMRVADRLTATAYTETGQLLSLTGYDLIYGPAAYCLFQLNDLFAAAVCTEWGKSRMLARALVLRDLDLAGLPEATVRKLTRARQEVRRLDARMRAEPNAATSRELRKARGVLDAAMAGAVPADPRLRMAEIGASVPTPGAVVLPVITARGGVIFTLVRDLDGHLQLRNIAVDWLTTAALHRIVFGTDNDPGWIPRYRLWRDRLLSADEWRASVRTHLAMLWDLLVERIAVSLNGAVPDGTPVTIVPDGVLSFLPCHAAAPDGNGVGGLLDRYPVAYSPSVYALRASQRRDTALDRIFDVLAVVDPSGDLDFARDEGTFLADVAPRNRLLHGSDATLRQVTAVMTGRSHLHFACHGSYDPDNAVRSGLRLADGTLTVADILDPGLNLEGTRLVTLSACETGLIDTRYAADEFIGLPSAFLQAGACGVISTLWPVQDRATSLLIRRFYQHHLAERLAPAEALRAAQRWLRDITGAELDDGSASTDRPYGDPYYWAAFQLTGT